MGAVNKMLAATKGLFLLVLTAVPYSSGRPMSAQVFEVGDMVLTAEQLPQELRLSFGLPEGSIMESSGVKNEAYRWPGGILSYELSNAVSSEDKTLIRNTLDQLETKLDSCIKFREADSGFRVIVNRESGRNPGCWSSVGYNGNGNDGSQDMSLDAGGCMDPGTIEHEFYHAIGVWHTQSRTDRDDHVKINLENIIDGEKHNFVKKSESEVSEFRLPYDFESVMHYSDTAYSKNEKKTIETIDPSKQDIIGNSDGVSEGDILLVKRMYGCTDGTPPSPPTPTTGLIDQVEGDYVQSSPPASNDWHYVSISKKEENVFTWKNKAGVEWDLVLSGEERDGAVRFKVGDNCLYKKDGYTEALLSAKGDSIEIEGPSGMFTKAKK